MPSETLPAEAMLAWLAGSAVMALLALLAGGALGLWLARLRHGGRLVQALLAGLTALCLPGLWRLPEAGGLLPRAWVIPWSAQPEPSTPLLLAVLVLVQAALAMPLVALLARAPLAAGWARHGRALRSCGAGRWRAGWLVARTQPSLWVALWLIAFARTLLDLAALTSWRETYRRLLEPPWGMGLLGLGLLAAILAGLLWPPARGAGD